MNNSSDVYSKINYIINALNLKLDKSNNVIVDGGFFRGSFSDSIVNNIEDIYCYGFEPNIDFYKLAKEKYFNSRKIIVSPLALSNKIGSSEIYISHSHPGTSSLLPRPNDENRKQYFPSKAIMNEKRIISTITLDHFCEENHINNILLLKLDLQGGEKRAIEGAKRLLKHNKILLIFTETVFIQKYLQQPLLVDIWNLLAEYGFRLHSFYDLKVGSYESEKCLIRSSQANQCNTLFISNKIVEIIDNI